MGSKVDPAPPATPPSTETVVLTLTRTCTWNIVEKYCNMCNHLCFRVSPKDGTCTAWVPSVVSDWNDTAWNFSTVRTACTGQLQKNVAAATGIYTTDRGDGIDTTDGGWTRAFSVYNKNWTNWTYAQDELDSLISIEQLVSPPPSRCTPRSLPPSAQPPPPPNSCSAQTHAVD